MQTAKRTENGEWMPPVTERNGKISEFIALLTEYITVGEEETERRTNAFALHL